MKIVRQTVEYPSIFGKLGDREFKKAVVICLDYKLSAVGQYIFVLLKEAPVCKASLRVARLRPRIAEIEKYSGNGIRLENFGNLRGVSVYKAKILRKASGIAAARSIASRITSVTSSMAMKSRQGASERFR